MKANTIEEIFSHLRIYFQKKGFSRKEADETPPLRSELFTREQMAQHAEQLASFHQLNYKQAPEQLLKRLSENEEVLIKVTDLLQDAVKEKQRISPAGEWLLDNFYLIEEQILTGKRYLPKGYSKGLPRLVNGTSAGLPRVYDIALEIISHSDGHVDISSLSNFINSYQKKNPLTIGELWAIPIMLRLALLENLRRVAARIAIDRIDENLAQRWAEKMLDAAEKNPKDLVLIIADMARSDPPMVSAFVAPFTQRLQWRGSELSLALSWLEQHLSEKGTTINSMMIAENQRQAANQVSMSNSINSLRFLAKMDWREFVETMSVVEQTLREDVNATYQKMDFYTRDAYRHVVEKIAKKTSLSEKEIAGIAIGLAKESAQTNPDDLRKAHVGYYLIGKGKVQTENRAIVKLSSKEAFKRFIKNNNPAFYILASLGLTFVIVCPLFLKAYRDGLQTSLFAGLIMVLLVCASQLAISLVNWFTTLLVRPKQLPRMNFCSGIPDDCRTLVVVPSMLVNAQQIEKVVEELEVRFLANKDPNLFFALLTDFKDSKEQTVPGDEELVNLVQRRITELNKKYGREYDDLFFLFHRPRLWNPKERVWMGWERKRGKLVELNHLLRANLKESFSVIVGEERVYRNAKYIITLDADTQLPRESAWKLIGIMAHPLNHALYDEKKKRIVDGYGIIQPRIAISLHGAVRSPYTRMHENDSGIDPYTRVTSNVYQDLFNEGSFTGKGIYDIDVFETILNNRFPENKILSHDLLEGAYTRCAYASDIQLYEEYPSRYRVDMNRRHRWIRGDWQISNWLLPFVPDAERRFTKNPISALSRWKIFDNLRRSLVPVGLLLLLVGGWTVLDASWFWTLCVTAIVILPSLVASGWEIIMKPSDTSLRHHFTNSAEAIYRNILQAVFTLICLPYEAFISLDAVFRTAWRMVITKRKLLEWNPYGFDQNSEYRNLFSVYISMWIVPLISMTILIYLTIYRPVTLLNAFPFLAAWMLSPAIVWWLSRPLYTGKTKLNQRQVYFLRKLTRKTWAFFENFLGPEDNWLPPDNFQMHPITILAHRTSPTNIGLALLANLAAYDFGYITGSQLIDRTLQSMLTMQKMDRYNGHFYNWYDTVTLKPLLPKYVSSVDSGNLQGHLLTLRQGLSSIPSEQLSYNKILAGLHDSTMVITDLVKKDEQNSFLKLQAQLKDMMDQQLNDPRHVKDYLNQLLNQLLSLGRSLNYETRNELYWWIEIMNKQIAAAIDEISFLTPWLALSAIPEKFKEWEVFSHIPSLNLVINMPALINEAHGNDTLNADENEWLEAFRNQIDDAVKKAKERMDVLQKLITMSEDFANMEFDFLYDKSQHLLAIGYNVEEHRRDASFYDLLASEARLSSFVAIAQGKIPQENWFALGRRLTNAAGIPVLLSWSGSMFEYLMPNLVMPSYDNTLLDQTNKGVVKKQIEYGRQHDTVWGISESCYNVVDAHLNYQYRAFGVPGLGFKRGLADDFVIAPYASVLGLMVDAEASFNNLERMHKDGYHGRYGFFESIDFTPSRLPRGQNKIVIQTYMAHHLGMSLLSLAYLLLDQPMQKRFEAEPRFQATLLLLQEQIPKAGAFYTASTNVTEISATSTVSEMRVIKTPDTIIPEVQLLSNGSYHVMVTNAGGGYSRWKEIAVTRWREDTTCDNWGTFCFIRDLKNNVFWSTAYQPTLREAKKYEAVFSQGRAEYRRLDNDIETHTEIIVSPEDDIEIRRIQITNKSDSKREIEITSYAEVVLAHPVADASHPAFSNLFVETEIIEDRHAILCTRRPRSKDESQPWLFHLMKVNNKKTTTVSYESDRNKFIGRGYSVRHPQVMNDYKPLSNTQGSVLDPVVSVRYVFMLEEDETIMLDMMLGIAESKIACQGLIDKYQDRHLRDRAFELSWTHSQVVLRQINASEAEAQLYGKLAGSVIYANPYLRAHPDILLKNHRGQSALWSYSISGDLPIVLLQITASENMSLVKQLVEALAYWKLKGLIVDLFIWNEDQSGYRQVLQDQIQSLVTAGSNFSSAESRGRTFVRPADQISAEDRILLQTVARVIISDKQGSLANQVNKKISFKNTITQLGPSLPYLPVNELERSYSDLAFFNGLGGFSSQGHEYIITTDQQPTPAPWVNVLANKNFGTVISEKGSSYTWFENAHEFRLTPWNNDPVSDEGGEAFYIRDEKTGYFWSPMPYPVKGRTSYITKHGFGYSVFEHSETGIVTDTVVFTDVEKAIKFIVINIHNVSGKERKISVTGYIEWVLGDLRSKSAMHVVTEYDNDTGALLARNPYNFEFENRVAFFDTDDTNKTFTANRAEFIGRNNDLQNPDIMKREKLSGKYGAGLDSCAAMQVLIDLGDNEKRQIVFRTGAARSNNEAKELITQFKGNSAAMDSLDRVHRLWQQLLTTIQVETPDKAFNLMTNGWLLYQTISCRLWGRSGFYQSGGAYGFRDQLQDVLSVLHTNAQLAREQILLSASRQFKEGDVQHWWHPPLGRGVRTHCSDDFLWLPFVTSKYVQVTGDTAILEEKIPFLEGRLVNRGEESYYDLPNISDEKASLYEHCKRAINRGYRLGVHGLPLIGSGDWNDGMNMVGKDGKGESVWLAFFLYDVLKRFIKIASLQNDSSFTHDCDRYATELEKNVNQNAWDGNWYLRAFFDDGTPIGSASSEECKIDSIAQSWSVLSGAGENKRSQVAMEAVYKFLVRKNDRLIQLLQPPFDHSDIDPGYIKGYVPGVRENGGQYTHAAIWTVMAFAKMGDNNRAWELLQMLNPIEHGKDENSIAIYKTEPYVIAADVYGVTPHTGRGGWTWYTGSAGWFYQLLTESFIGLHKEGNKLIFNPCVPDEWQSFNVHYRFNDTMYHINFIRDAASDKKIKITVDESEEEEKYLVLSDDKAEHHVTVYFNPKRFVLSPQEEMDYRSVK